MTDKHTEHTDPSPVDRLKAEAERAKETVEEVKAEVSKAVDQHRDGPATSVSGAAQKAARLRQGIERDLATLSARVPDPEQISSKAKIATASVAGGAVAIGSLVAVLKKRGETKKARKKAHLQAKAIAAELAQIDVEALAKEATEDGHGGRTKWLLGLLVAAVGAAAVVLQVRGETTPEDVFGEEIDLGPGGVGAVPPGPSA